MTPGVHWRLSKETLGGWRWKGESTNDSSVRDDINGVRKCEASCRAGTRAGALVNGVLNDDLALDAGTCDFSAVGGVCVKNTALWCTMQMARLVVPQGNE